MQTAESTETLAILIDADNARRPIATCGSIIECVGRLCLAAALCSLVGLFGALPAHAADPALGTLPPNSLSTSDTSGVDAEICRDHLFDPSSLSLDLPAGYRLRTAEEVSATDPALAEWLSQHPSAKRFAVGSLCFMSFRTFIIDGKPLRGSRDKAAAFWWAAAEGPLHADMRGKARWVQLRSWYSRSLDHKRAIRRTDPMAQFTDIEIAHAAADDWHLRLVLPNETVEADIHTTSPSVPRKSSGPGYMSVPMSGKSMEYFSVFTYAGHHSRDAQGEWRAAGTGVFSSALALPNEASVLGTVFQEGWTARSGLYRFSNSN
jgi:hypothetical protein